MAHEHESYVDGCFTCKLRTLNFEKSWMPSQGQKASLDTKGLARDLGTDRDGQERTLDKTRGVGHLMWKNNEPYKKNRSDGTWERASANDMETLLGATRKERSRTY